MLPRLKSILNMFGPPADTTGKLIVAGKTVPTDTTPGYATGCIFQHIDGGDGTALYVNEGTVTSCDFNAITVA
jgi:hypothetical protein